MDSHTERRLDPLQTSGTPPACTPPSSPSSPTAKELQTAGVLADSFQGPRAPGAGPPTLTPSHSRLQDSGPCTQMGPETGGPHPLWTAPSPAPFAQTSLPQPRELPPGRLPNGLEPPERTPRPDRPRARDRPKPRRRPRPREGGEGGGSRRSRSAPAQGGAAPAPPPPPAHTVQHEGFLLRKREVDANRKSSNR